MHRWTGAILGTGVLAASVLWAPPAWAGTGVAFSQQIKDCVCINGAPVGNGDQISFHFTMLDENTTDFGGCGNFFLGGGKAGGGLLNGEQSFTTNASITLADTTGCFYLFTVCPGSVELNGAPVAVSNFCGGILQFEANGDSSPAQVSFSGLADNGETLRDFHFTVDDPINVNIAGQAQGAPEIDAGAMAAPAALFIGGLLVLSDRRKRS